MTQILKLLSISALVIAAGCAYEEPPPTTAYSTGYGHSVGPAYSSSTYTTYGRPGYTQSPYVTNGVYSYTPPTPGSSYQQSPSGTAGTTVYSSLPNESVGTSVDAQVSANAAGPTNAAPVTQVTGPDNGLVATIRQELGNYGKLSTYADALDISAYEGAVTLKGMVGSRQDRDAIDAVIRNIQGVTSVNDRLQVAGLPTGATAGYVQSSRLYAPNAAPEAATPVAPVPQANTADAFNLHVRGLTDADRDVAQRIITGLQTDTTVVDLMPKVNITVEQGRVFLRGTASSEQQREQIINAVSRASGTSVNADQLLVAH